MKKDVVIIGWEQNAIARGTTALTMGLPHEAGRDRRQASGGVWATVSPATARQAP
ncbi:MAG TPA: hypothetical protein VGW38_23995 [Chloroflexota bacterium]|nr:hypothetical protein [Chloroflexota bacterium]